MHERTLNLQTSHQTLLANEYSEKTATNNIVYKTNELQAYAQGMIYMHV